MFTWTFTTETPAWQFCFYTNGNWTSFEEPIAVSVFYVTEMKAVDLGADNILVRRVEKEFGVLGNGVERTATTCSSCRRRARAAAATTTLT